MALGHIVLDADPAHRPKKRTEPPQFSAHFYCGQTAGCIKMVLGMEVGLGPRHIVLDGDTAPSPQKGAQPQFLADFYCGQAAGCIKMPFGMEVGPGLRDIVFDVDPATPRKKGSTTPNQFWPMSIVAKWLDG